MFLLTFVFAGFANAQQIEIDSRDSARAFATNPAVEYRFDVYYFDQAGGVSSSGYGRMNIRMEIVEFYFNNTQIVFKGEDPLPALPFPVGVRPTTRNFWMDGIGQNGNYVSRGHLFTDYPIAGDPIVVELYPNEQQQVINYQAPVGVDPDNLVIRDRMTSVFIGHWDNWRQNFSVYVDPLGGPVQYEIVNTSTGIVYSRGTLIPFSGPIQKRSDDTVLNVKYVGGVQRVDMDNNDSNQSFPNQTFTGQTTIERDPIPCAVYFIEPERGERLPVKFSYWGPIGTQVIIEEIEEFGPPNILQIVMPERNDDDEYKADFGSAEYEIFPSGKAVRITVIPTLGTSEDEMEELMEDLEDEGFYLWFYKGSGKG